MILRKSHNFSDVKCFKMSDMCSLHLERFPSVLAPAGEPLAAQCDSDVPRRGSECCRNRDARARLARRLLV